MSKFDTLKKLINAVAPTGTAKKAAPVIDEVRAKQLAKAYADMKHSPNDPDVARSYDALIKETIEQYNDLITNKGLKVSRIESGMDNPYKASSDLVNDVRDNNHMWFYPTEQGFGSSVAAASDNPLLKLTDHKVGDKPMAANDLFRVVHDYYGHVKPEFKFGARGEEGAWREHMPMFSPEAQKALTSETRGQNSWVNYGPFGEANRANPANTVYAEQKTGLLPDWAKDVSDPEGIPVVTYGDKGIADSSKFEEFANSRPAADGGEKYSTRIKGKIYDFSADPEGLLKQSGGDLEQAKALAQQAGYDGIASENAGKKFYETFKSLPVRASYGVAGALGAGAVMAPTEQAEASSKTRALEYLSKLVPDLASQQALRSQPEKYGEYLKTLDEAYGPQLERAKEMGFGAKQTFYHGTPQTKIDSFDPSLSGTNSLGPGKTNASYFSSNPDVAASYAGDNGNVMPVKINRRGTIAIEPEWSTIGYDEANQIRDALKTNKNVTMKNVYDSPNPDMPKSDIVAVRDPSTIRSTNAAFDPRFKDSSDIMAMQAPKKGMFQKTMDVISAPQRYVMNKGAEALGVKGNPEDSEGSAQAIVEKLAEKVGIPEDSTVGNAAKALGVAGLEVFADPLNALPLGPAMKMLKPAKEAVQKFPSLKKMFKVGDKTFPATNTAEALKVKHALEESGQVGMNRALQKLD